MPSKDELEEFGVQVATINPGVYIPVLTTGQLRKNGNGTMEKRILQEQRI
ncbi:hypothetical protein Q5O89_09350 [Peribacillus frigoritolerans]|nr:hypothetical protein [Peribacillus frigoritolerans]